MRFEVLLDATEATDKPLKRDIYHPGRRQMIDVTTENPALTVVQ